MSVAVSETVKKSKASHVYRGRSCQRRTIQERERERERERQGPWGTHPSDKCDGEKGPLAPVELGHHREGVGSRQHGRRQRGEARREVAANRHAMMGRVVVLVSAGVLGDVPGGLFCVCHVVCVHLTLYVQLRVLLVYVFVYVAVYVSVVCILPVRNYGAIVVLLASTRNEPA